MKDAVYQEINPVVQRAARAAARRWPGLDAGDLENEAWQIALEALARYDEAKGERVHYVARTLKIALRNACYRMTLPVHFPRNREWIAAGTRAQRVEQVEDHIEQHMRASNAAQVDLDDAIDLGRALAAVRAAVEHATQGEPEIRSVLLSGGQVTPAKLARTFGLPLDQVQRRTREVYAQLRDEVVVPRAVLRS